jgi:hypothetical protein
MTQTFIDRDANGWTMIDFLPGVTLLPLAEPVREGSIHRARLSRGAVIPVHTHPADEYVMVLNGAVETGGRRCETGTFRITTCRYSARSAYRGHRRRTSDRRLGPMGSFGE